MTTRPTAVVLGAGPGLGMSMAHRFAKEGYSVALVSRTAERHPAYLAGLDNAEAFAGDVRNGIGATLDEVTERFGGIDVAYYGPAAIEPDSFPTDITEATVDAVEKAMSWVYPAVEVVGKLLPGMLERGSGGFLFAGGLSAVRPMPALGALAVSSAALRNYARTLHEGLAGTGVYAGSLIIGGLVERGDIHRMVVARREKYGDAGGRTLDPDAIAGVAWKMFSAGDPAESVFDAV
ncbi:SDR family NAD(P)-dependent oxidoreductase [Amycolatopsis rubida]|uniref:SDR family NAD(P)-dependent oxidoreductase n=1 Tax=Amycolatopsis rubida TaxID=112413 RepID=A0ABX0BKY5_9PSEU|nr:MULTISPECIES: SDR family NAD(P)-dependent oxidoreductase [Amycolatopsis]MYW91055.1 SDR family NAD(P)-dependent oxidoreductase [Amycolatopsis rubida]NEC56040.1 SDR family NAD(P)-dependent oxidoreductase [Amycolatopsis rubida]OAP22147.1 putative oxidoreductase [Amycolatopsis sp. M39]